MSYEGPILAGSVAVDGYPGDRATPIEVLELADDYRSAAESLFEAKVRGKSFRSNAIHAIELYLNAALLFRGMPASEVRSHLHDLSIRVTLLRLDPEIILKKATRIHLMALNERQEYIRARYGAGDKHEVSPLNRIQATLTEISTQVSTALKSAK